MGLFLLLLASYIVFTENYISVFSPLGEFRLYWDEIESIEIGYQGTIVLKGENKRLVIPSHTYWSGSQKEQALQYLNEMLQIKNISLSHNFYSDMKMHKNVKMDK